MRQKVITNTKAEVTMQYKILDFMIRTEYVSTGFFSDKKITAEEKREEMQTQINELAKEGWRVNQMSTNPIIDRYGTTGGIRTDG